MKKRHLKVAAGFIVLCMMLLAMIGAAAEDWHLPLMSLNAGTPLTGESFSFSWEKWSGADYYEYSVADRTSGETIRNHKRTTGRNGSVSSGNLEYGHHLHIWVGAYIDDVLSAQAHGDVYVACGMHEYVNGRCACGEVCDHDWNSKGICKECEMKCPHDDTYEKETSITGVSISDTKHELITTYNEVCWDCYVVVRKGLTKISTGKHKLDANGDCTMCDFGSGCAHEKTKHVERTTSYEYLNDNEHRVKVVYDVVCANANCGKLIEYGGYITSEKEAHSFKSGACQYCGFSIATPLSATVSRSASTISLGKNITGRCVATGGSGSYEYAWGGYMGSQKYFSQYYSSESFYTFAPNKVGTWKIHVYVRDKETGDKLSLYTAEFTVTEAVEECTHARYTDVPRNTSEYVKISDSSHKVVTKVDRVCDDCGEVINTTDKVETQAHSYSGGKCSLCGSVQPTPECAHSAMKSTELSRKVRKTDSNAEHVIDITWKDVCSSCGVTLNTTRTTYVAENHSFDASGVCKCGYVKPTPTCDHADAQKVFVSSRTERSDAQRHVVITTYRLQCPCGVIVNPSVEERAHFQHTFENSKCIHCGEEQVITPPPVTAPPVTPAPEDVVCTVHGTAHVLDYTGYEAVHPHKVFRRCDCGVAEYTGSYRTTDGTVYTAAEVPDDHVCCLCLGHHWDEEWPYQLGDKWYVPCINCDQAREVNASEQLECMHKIDPSAEEKHIDENRVRNINDPDIHMVDNGWHYENTCTLCGKLLDYGYVSKSEQELHSFDEQGICTSCGYVAMNDLYDVSKRFVLYVESDYMSTDGDVTYIGVNELASVSVYDRLENRYTKASLVPGLSIRLRNNGCSAVLQGNTVKAGNSGMVVLELYFYEDKVDELNLGVTLLSVEDEMFEYNISTSGTVRMDDLNNVDWDDCNVVLTGNVVMSNYQVSREKFSDIRKVSFDVFNSSAVVVGVAAYDAQGNQISMKLIKPYWGTGSFVKNAWNNTTSTVRVWDGKYGNDQNTTKTHVVMDVPAGGYIQVLEMHENSQVFAANVAESLLGTVKIYNTTESLVNPVNLKEMESLLESLGKDEYYLATYNYLLRKYGHDFPDMLIAMSETADEVVDMSMVVETVIGGDDNFFLELVGALPGAVVSEGVNKAEDALSLFVPGLYHIKYGFQMAHDSLGMYQLFDAYERCMIDGKGNKYVGKIVTPNWDATKPDEVEEGEIITKRYLTITNNTKLLDKPSPKYSIWADVPVGAQVELLGSETDEAGNLYYKVYYRYTEAYIPAMDAQVEKLGKDMTQIHTSFTDDEVHRREIRVVHAANLRMDANIESEFEQRVFPGTVLTYYGEKNGWYWVTSPGGVKCYIFAEYAEFLD